MFSFNQLRFEMTTTQLIAYCKHYGIDISHIELKKPSTKRKIVDVIFDKDKGMPPGKWTMLYVKPTNGDE